MAQERTTFPGISRRPWHAGEVTRTLLTSIVALGGSVTTLALNWPATKDAWSSLSHTFLAAAVTTALLLATSFISLMGARYKDKKQSAHETPTDISGCLHVIHSILKRYAKISDSEADEQALRITVYSVTGHDLVQVVEYVGGDGGKPGRKVSIRSGVIGRAAITGMPVRGERDNADAQAFIEEMIHKWHFTKEEAHGLSMDRWDSLAIPIKGGKGSDTSNVIGVVYFDSTRKKFFNKRVENIVTAACSGLTSFIEKRNNEG